MKRPLLASLSAFAFAALLAAGPAAAQQGGSGPNDQSGQAPNDQGGPPPNDQGGPGGGYQGGPGGGDQGGQGGQGGGDQGGQAPADQGGDSAGDQGDQASAAPVSLSDAKANVGTLIQAFIAQHSEGGIWPLRDKHTKQLRKLKLVKVYEKGVKPAGKARFSAPAALTDEVTGQTLEATFITDFSGADWKVVGMRLKRPAAARAK